MKSPYKHEINKGPRITYPILSTRSALCNYIGQITANALEFRGTTLPFDQKTYSKAAAVTWTINNMPDITYKYGDGGDGDDGGGGACLCIFNFFLVDWIVWLIIIHSAFKCVVDGCFTCNATEYDDLSFREINATSLTRVAVNRLLVEGDCLEPISANVFAINQFEADAKNPSFRLRFNLSFGRGVGLRPPERLKITMSISTAAREY